MSRFAVPLMIAVACGPAPPPAVAPAAVAIPPEAMPPEAMPIDAGLPPVVAAAGQVGVQLAGQPRIEVPILDVRRSPGGHVIVFEPGPPGVIGHDATIRVRAPQVAEGVPPARPGTRSRRRRPPRASSPAWSGTASSAS